MAREGLLSILVLPGVFVDLEAEFGEFTRRIKEDEHEGGTARIQTEPQREIETQMRVDPFVLERVDQMVQ